MNLKFSKIKHVKNIGVKNTLDFEVDHEDHNFYAEGVLVSNSHGFSYSNLTAICAYLKANHPTEFFYSLLKNVKHETKPQEEISAIFEELPKFGIELLSPSLTKSDIDFTIEGKNQIRMGLGNVKGIADKAIEKLKNFKHAFANKFEIFQSAEEAGLNVGVMSALVQAGTMDDFLLDGDSRTKMVLDLQLYRLLSKKERINAIEVGQKWNFDLVKLVNSWTKSSNVDIKPIIKQSRVETIKAKYDKYKAIYNQNSKNEELASYFYESKLLGFCYSQSLYSILKKYHPDLMTVNEVEAELDKTNKNLIFGGEIKDVIYSTSRNAKKTKYVKLKIQDNSGSVYAMLFNNKVLYSEAVNGGKFEVGQIVVCEGQKFGDSVFCDTIGLQDAKVYLKLSELKNDA